MEIIDSKNLDHHGLVSGIIADLGLQTLIDNRLPKDSRAKISDGQAVSAMIINSLGFTSRPLSLTPHFFSSKAVDVLFGEGVEASDFNRHRLGRCLDKIYAYGCDKLFSELAHTLCRAEGISKQFMSLDTTSFKVTGAYEADTDEHQIEIVHGFSKDHRPDLKQVVLELLVSQDGGVPLISKSFDGNASDSHIFRSRCKELVKQFQEADSPRYLIADSKLYNAKNAEHLNSLTFITRIPRTLKEERQAVSQALEASKWVSLDKTNQYYCYNCEHYGIEQRWLVVFSDAAHMRAKKTLEKQLKKEKEQAQRTLKGLRNDVFNCEADAHAALNKVERCLKYHQLSDRQVLSKPGYSKKGRPKLGEQPTHFSYVATAKLVADEEKQTRRLNEKSCYVVGTNASPANLSDQEVINAYKRQNASIERGFRFLKDPYFFATSFFIKKPSRIMALLTVMTLALVIYSITQRRLRQSLEACKETLPNQINQPRKKPTLRWVFQMLEGINVIYIKAKNTIKKIYTGLNTLKTKIIKLFPEKIRRLYGFDKNAETGEEMCSM